MTQPLIYLGAAFLLWVIWAKVLRHEPKGAIDLEHSHRTFVRLVQYAVIGTLLVLTAFAVGGVLSGADRVRGYDLKIQ